MSAPSESPAFRCFAERPHGVHALPRSEAAALLRGSAQRSQGDSPAAADEAEHGGVVWIDLANPDEEAAAFLRDELGFHPLAVEDCVRGRQRPKLDRYPGYFFLVFYAASVNPERQRMALNEVHLFLGPNYLVTVHDHRVREVGEVLARWRANPGLFAGVGALAHALVDALVDHYFVVLEHFADRADRLENEQITGSTSAQPVLRLRHELMMFRRVVAPERDVLSTLLRRDLPFQNPDLIPYFQDVHDHTIRVTEELDTQRELLATLVEAQRSEASQQLNRTVRMLTAWSIILMTVTLIAGIYGMNFERMPELQWRFGYPSALLLMLVVGLGLVWVFRRRRWM